MSSNQTVIKAASREIVRGRASGTFLTFSIPLEHKNGHVFLLADIDSACKVAPQVISLLRETVERLGRSLSDKAHLQHRFEQTLQSVNEDLKDLINVKTCPPESLNMVIGVLKQDTFIISATGSLPALFLRRTAKQRFRVFDLQQNISTEAGQIKPEKLFHVVLDGDLAPDDVLLLASRDLHRLISVEDIHPLISTLPPGSALETIEQYLPTNAKLAMLLFQIRKEKEVITGFGPEVSSDASMKALTATEQTTEQMLDLEKPNVLQSFGKLAGALKSGDRLERRATIMRILRSSGKTIKTVGMFLLHAVSNAVVSAFSLFHALFTRGSKRERAIDDAKSAWSRTWKSGHKFQLTSLTGRMLLVSAVIFIVLFSGSIAYFNIGKNQQAAEAAFLSQLELIDDKRDQAAASIIYNDDAAARTLLNDASAILLALDADGKSERQAEIDQRQADIENQLSQIRKIISPEITTTPIINKLVSASSGTTLFFQDGKAGSFANNSINDIDVSGSSTPLKIATAYDNDAVGIDQDNNFVYFDTANSSISQIGINSAESEAEQSKDLVHYGERLYVLSGNQVYRHQRVEGGEYGPGAAWIQDDTDITAASSIAIDGTVWIASGSALRHFDGGREVGAQTTAIDPPLGSIKDIWTDTDAPILLMLDIGEKRVVAYNKETGDMVAQIISDEFGSAISIHADVGSKTAIVVSPTTVHSFSIQEIF
ncbi:hypothetical protein HOI83_00075 [Candidatus Uhrbacteria bacterium]|nr:hypothetical protein [Candidatus Uhrbacteria bacterium]